ncbi:MAG: sensor histidine kinase [Bryobacteraceae bacterium]
METIRRQAWLSWASVGVLIVLCGTLAVLQYQWIGEISRAEQSRLREALEASLSRLSQDFNTEITAACAGLVPDRAEIERSGRDGAYAARYRRWKDSGRDPQLIRTIAVAVPEGDGLKLLRLDETSGLLSPGDWPGDWIGTRDRLLGRLRRPGFGGPGPGPGFGPPAQEGSLIDIPRFARGPERRGPMPFGGAAEEWLVVEIDVDYVRQQLLPELLRRHLGQAGAADLLATVTVRNPPSNVIFQSDPQARRSGEPDASVFLFEARFEQLFRRAEGPEGRFRGGPRRGPGVRGPDPGRGRWLLSVQHRAGSLEAIVTQARWRNLAVSAGILLLMLVAVYTLVRFSRQAQRLAELQMEFVAGVSHELRTPLAVIRTAAFNLRGRVASNPPQVERYGDLIQQESEKLSAVVEQILRFAAVKAGHVIGERTPVPVPALIEDCVQSTRAALDSAKCLLEQRIDPGLPAILGDATALKHAIQNLLQNAIKYGTEGSNWIGLFAVGSGEEENASVEIRVADRGPGIPPEEQPHLFDPFFRGSRAIGDQIHGTGLGLNLVKKIVEAHGGTVRVESEPMKGTVFIIRIPAAPAEQQDEFAHTSG